MSPAEGEEGIESFLAYAIRRNADSIRQEKTRHTPVRWIVLEAHWQALQLGDLLAPTLLAALLPRRRVSLEEVIRAFARDYLHNRTRYKKRFGDSAQKRDTRRQVQRDHDLVAVVERELAASEREVFKLARDRDKALAAALRRAGIPEDGVADAAILVPSIMRGNSFAFFKLGRARAAAVAAVSGFRGTGVEIVRIHCWACPRLQKLIRRANSPSNKGLFIRERRKAFASCSAGKARLEELRAQRRLKRLAKRRARHRGQRRAAKSLT